MKKVSIIIPVFNAKKYLKKAINSVLKQTYVNWELILVDDGSSDDSSFICDSYAARDNRIRAIHQANSGCIAARRKGVQSASGDYILFLDADDSISEQALFLLVAEEERNHYKAVIIGNMQKRIGPFLFKPRYEAPCFQIKGAVNFSHQDFIDQLYCSWFGISNVPVSLCAKLFPADLVIRTFENTANLVQFFGEDLLMTIDILPQAHSVSIIPQYIYHYRIGGGSTSFREDMLNDFLSLYRVKKEYFVRYPMPQNIQKLMDVELCNVTFSFFESLYSENRLTIEKVQEICEIQEIYTAAQNPDISADCLKAKMLREKNGEEIIRYFCSQKLLKAKKKTKKALISLLQ